MIGEFHNKADLDQARVAAEDRMWFKLVKLGVDSDEARLAVFRLSDAAFDAGRLQGRQDVISSPFYHPTMGDCGVMS